MSIYEREQAKIARHALQFCTPKSGTSPKNFISIKNFVKGNIILQPKDSIHVEDMIHDPTIIKEYYAPEVPEEYQYLIFISLGIEYLKRMGEFEKEVKGLKILKRKIQEELSKNP